MHSLVLGNENEGIVVTHSNVAKSYNQNVEHKSQTPEETHSMVPFIWNSKISQTN